MKKFTLLFISLFLISCTTPVSHTNSAMSTYDKDTEYSIQQYETGFGLTVYYSRYQLIPESSALVNVCKSMLTSIAWESAAKNNKQISPINEQQIRLSTGRNGLTGITSCQAFVSVEYEK